MNRSLDLWKHGKLDAFRPPPQGLISSLMLRVEFQRGSSIPLAPLARMISPYRHTQPGQGLPVVNRLSALVSLATSMVQVESPVMGSLHSTVQITKGTPSVCTHMCTHTGRHHGTHSSLTNTMRSSRGRGHRCAVHPW